MSACLLEKIASDEILDQAYTWLCDRRKDSHHNNDVWHLRFHWLEIKAKLQQQLLQGEYYFSPCRSYRVNGKSIGVWDAQDALVLKAMSLVLTVRLSPELSEHCYHLPGRGGTKACVMQVKNVVQDYGYVCRSDVNSYYATINHQVLLKQLSVLLPDQKVILLIQRMLNRLDDVNGELFCADVGINKGNPLSPLLGAVYLKVMDDEIGEYCQRRGLRYFRYMDDWLILCKTRNQLRTVVRLMNRVLESVKQSKHPFKTFIGRVKDEGFDFLGYRIGDKRVGGLGVAWATWVNHLAKLQRLYGQNASVECVAGYVKRWLVWVRSGVEIELRAAVEGLVGVDLVDELYVYYKCF